MKKLLLIFCFIALTSMSAFSQNGKIEFKRSLNKTECTDSRFEGFSVNISFGALQSTAVETPEGTFSSIYIDGAYNSGDLGSPQLPSFHKLIYIPEKANPSIIVKSFTTSEYKLTDYDITTLYPVQESYSKSEKPENIKFSYNREAYLASKNNKSEIATIELLGSMREVQIGKLYVNPIVYDYENGTITVYNDIEIDIVFENVDTAKSESKINKSYSPYFTDVYKRLFNGETLLNNNKATTEDLIKYPVRMLVVANRMFEEALKPWVEWKTMKGYSVDIAYTDVIGTTANDIKGYCAEKYNSAINSEEDSNIIVPSFVIIVGDIAQVVASDTGNKTQKKTDLYYGSIDGDMYPEMYYSRISATNATELTNYINKLIYYEKYNFEDPTYLDDVTLIAGWDSNWNPKVGKPTVQYWTTNYFNSENGFDKVDFWLTSPYTGCYNTVNEGKAVVNYTAHGDIDCWGDPLMTVSMVNNLTNTNKYSIAVGNCCLSGDFGSNLCFGEAWIRASEKGAVGYIGSSPNSYWYEDYYWAVGAFPYSANGIPPTVESSGMGVYDALFNDKFTTLCGMITVGNMAVDEAVSSGFSTSVGSLYYWQAYNVLGDGSLSPYLKQGKTNEVTHDEVVYMGFDSFTLTAQSGSYAAISRDGVIAGVALANEEGNATIKFIEGASTITPGEQYDLVVTRAGYKPYFAKLQPTSLDAPYLTVKSCNVDNAHNSFIEGQTSTLTLTLENLGNVATASEVNVTMTCDDELLTIIDGSETYPIIEGKTTSAKEAGFNIKISPKTENGHKFTILYTAVSGDETWTGKFNILTIAPELQYKNFDVEGGSLVKGVVGHININVENVGDYVAEEVMVNLKSLSEYVTILQKEAVSVGNIENKEGKTASFTAYLNPNVPIGHIANFVVEITYLNEDKPSNGTFEMSWSQYCVPEVTNCNSDKIIDVVFAGINNIGTDCSTDGYGDYTNLIGSVEPNTTYTFTVKAGYTNDVVYAWIDYNENGVFEESEIVVNGLKCSQVSQSYNANIIIPEDATPGVKRMRVRSFWSQSNIIPDPCTKVTQYGETEDYTVIISTPYVSPTGFNVIENDDKNISLTWIAPSSVTPEGYKIYRNDTLVNETLITECNFIDRPNKTNFYIYKLVAIYGQNESMPVFGFIDFEAPNSVSSLNDDVVIYPNPAKNTVNVRADNMENIAIFDMSGRLIKNYDLNAENMYSINTSALNQGVYLMVVKTQQSVMRKNIIIKR